MLRMLLALVIIVILIYNNPLSGINQREEEEIQREAIQKKVDEVQQQVDYAKKALQQEMDEVEKIND